MDVKHFIQKAGKVLDIARLGSISNLGVKTSQNQLSCVEMQPGLAVIENFFHTGIPKDIIKMKLVCRI